MIKLGHWIDMEGGLTVAAYNDEGGFTTSGGETLRLIMVGINSFNDLNGTTPHVVFQFQNVPVARRMNATDTNVDGYRVSEMRVYVTGNFLAGLIDAGVPEGRCGHPRGLCP